MQICTALNKSMTTLPDRHYNIREHIIYTIRQVDDLIMWIAYDRRDEDSLAEAQCILTEMFDRNTEQSTVYCDGLTIEEEEFELVDSQCVQI